MQPRFLHTCVSTAFVLALAVGAAAAGEGRQPIWRSPTVINSSGKYFLARNLPANPAGPVITILAGNVDLDLNGMEIDQSATPAHAAIAVVGGAEVRVHDGFILGGKHNILADTTQRIIIEDVVASNPAAEAFKLMIVGQQIVRDNLISCGGAPGAGIWITGATNKAGAIENNTIEVCNGGIQIEFAASMSIRMNRIKDTVPAGGPTEAGIYISDSRGVLIEKNVIEFVNQAGILLENSYGCKIYNNVVRESGDPGIYLLTSSDNLVRTNVVTETLATAPCGILIDGDRNYVEDNVVNSNTGYGLELSAISTGNVYRANQIQGNSGPGAPVCAGAFVPPDLCDRAPAGSNASFGDNFCAGPGPC